MRSAILLLGSNLGVKAQFLKQAIFCLEEQGVSIIAKSNVYESSAFGYNSKNSFYNVALEGLFKGSPEELLTLCLKVENKLGRERSESKRYADRVIDIDVILIEDLILNSTSLIIPHPRMHERVFCLKPIAELNPNRMIPTLKITVGEALKKLEFSNEVKKTNVTL